MPLVSVCILTYNHEKFLEQALTSVYSQTFWDECEVLIGEDASTDDTKKIVADFSDRHKDVVKPFYSPNGSLGFHRNLERLILAASGRYIAFLEGDDWWSDDRKLGLQVQMLEADPSLSFCGGITNVVNELSGKNPSPSMQSIQPPLELQRLGLRDLIYGFSFHASSVLMRRSCVSLPDWIFDQYCMDRPLYLLAALRGDAGVIRSPLSVYRLHSTGVWAPLDPEQKASRSVNLFSAFIKYFPRIYRVDFHAAAVAILWSYIGQALADKSPSHALRILARAWAFSPVVCITKYPLISLRVMARSTIYTVKYISRNFSSTSVQGRSVFIK